MTDRRPQPQARRAFLRAVGLAAMLLACGASLSAAPRLDRVPGRPAEPATPDAPHRIALLVPVTGPDSAVGAAIANAARLALADAGATDLQLTVYDTAKGAATAAERALAEGGSLFLGPLLAEDVEIVGSLARRRGRPVISFASDVGVAGGGVYVMGPTPGQSIERIVRHARGQELERFAALVPDSTEGERVAAEFADVVDEEGGRLEGIERYGRRANVADAARTLAARGRVDAVLIGGSGEGAAVAARAIRAALPNAYLVGTDSWSGETGLERHAALHGARFASISDRMFGAFRTRYRARYGRNPPRRASLGYDAALLAARIARRSAVR